MVIMIKDYEKMYIIGNGFDIANEWPTNYNSFRNFLIYGQLIEKTDDSDNGYEYKTGDIVKPEFDKYEEACTPESTPMPDGSEEFLDTKSLKHWYVQLVDNSCDNDIQLWSNYENILGQLEISDESFLTYDEMIDYDNDNDFFGALEGNEDMSQNLIFAIKNVHNLFVNWIQSIEEFKKDAQPSDYSKIKEFLNLNAFYLSFNYTNTLEACYHIDSNNIKHIHGYTEPGFKNKNNEYSSLIVGHGSDIRNDADKIYPGTFALNDIHNNLKKDVLGIIEKNQELWDKISHVKDIYCFGFSFGKVDMPYIEKIISSSAPHCCWHLNKFNEEESMEQKEKLKKLGIPEHEIKIEKFY